MINHSKVVWRGCTFYLLGIAHEPFIYPVAHTHLPLSLSLPFQKRRGVNYIRDHLPY